MNYRSNNEYQKLFDLKTIKYRMETLPTINRKIQNHSLTNRSQYKDKNVISEIESNTKIDRKTYKHFHNFKNRRTTLNIQKNAIFQPGILKQSSTTLDQLNTQSQRQNQSQNNNHSQRDILLNTKFFVSPTHIPKQMKQQNIHQNQFNEIPTDLPSKKKILQLQNTQIDFTDLIYNNICHNKNLGIKSKYKVISYAKNDNPQLISLKRDNENIDDDKSECNLVLFRSKKQL